MAIDGVESPLWSVEGDPDDSDPWLNPHFEIYY